MRRAKVRGRDHSFSGDMTKAELIDHLKTAQVHPGQHVSEPVKLRGRLFWGQPISVVLPEVVSSHIVKDGYHELLETILLINLLKPGMVFFDVGAHIGYFSLLASQLVEKEGRVHSFEPTPSTFELLQENSEGLSNIRLNNMAVYSHSTELEITDCGLLNSAFNSLFAPRVAPQFQHMLGHAKHRVQTISIDEYVRNTGVAPNFIKIDAESAEYDIIEGMRETLAVWRPMFSIEVGDMDIEEVRSSRDIVNFARSFGYEAYDFNGQELKPHQVQEKYEIATILFMPRG